MRPEIYTKTPDILLLGSHRYDRTTGRLEDSGGEVVHLRHQSAHILAVLAARPGEVVSRDTLIDQVWPDTATTDDSLIQCIADIRRTVGHAVIETFPKKGYLLRPGDGAKQVTPGAFREFAPLAVLVLAVTAVAAVLLLQPGPKLPDEPQKIVPPPVKSDLTLAVLPFVNLGGDPDLRFFSDGLSEDLTTDLSKVSRLTVISHLSSFDFPDAERDFQQIAENLGVRFLVRGTVRHDADRVRINVSLIDPFDGQNLWAERYDRDRGNPFDIQEQVTSEIVAALSLKLGADDTPDRPAEPDAYYMLLRGLESLRQLTPHDNLEARAYFRRALELDPEYARAYANIAVTYGREVMFRHAREVERAQIEKGLEAAVTAIQLDPGIPSAYFALGVLNLALGEYDNALAASRHSIRLDRNFSQGYALLSEVAVQGGDLDEALDAIRRAKLLHPHYPFSYDWIEGHILFQLGRYQEAEPLLQTAVDRNPVFLRGLLTLAANLGRQGETEAAKTVLDQAAEVEPGLSWRTEIAQTPYRFEERRDKLAEGLQVIDPDE